MRRIVLIATLALVGAALLAPAPAQDQNPAGNIQCVAESLPLVGSLSGGLSGLGNLLDLEWDVDALEACLAPFNEIFAGNDRFCDDCDSTFSFDEIREAIIEFDRGRALRQRLLECRNRRLNETHSSDSRRECGNLEQVFELYVNDENSLEARRKGGASPVSVNTGDPAPGDEAVASLALRTASPQQLRGGLTAQCGRPCQVSVIGRGVLIAKGGTSAPGTVKLRATRRGQRLLRRDGRIRARVIGGTRGAFSLGRLTVKP